MATMSKAKIKEWKSKLKKEKRSGSKPSGENNGDGESVEEALSVGEGKDGGGAGGPHHRAKQQQHKAAPPQNGKSLNHDDPLEEHQQMPRTAALTTHTARSGSPRTLCLTSLPPGASAQGDASLSSSPCSSPGSSRSGSPRASSAEENHVGQGAGRAAAAPTRSPRTVLRKKSYSSFDMPHQSLQSSAATPEDTSSRSGGSARRSKRRSAKALDAAQAVHTAPPAGSTEADCPAEGIAVDGGESADESGGKTWRRWSALVANMPLPLSSVLTKSNSFLLANSSDAPTTPHGSESGGTLRRRGATVMVMRQPEEEIKVLREHIEQLQILLQEKHNEVQHYKAQLQATKHELAALKNQMMNSTRVLPPVADIDEKVKVESNSEPNRTRSKSLGEGTLVEIGSDLYNDSEEGQAEEMHNDSPEVSSGCAKLDSASQAAEEKSGARKDDSKRKERKKSMLMAMSRVDHSRFGMEVGGRSSLRAKATKERGGNLSQMFTKIQDETASLSQTTRTGTAPPITTLDSGFLLEEEQDCDVTTTFFAAEGTNWYAEHFFGRPHRNLLGIETPLGTVLVSFKREEKAVEDKLGKSSNEQSLMLHPTQASTFYRVMLFTQDGDQRMFFPITSVGDHGGKDCVDKLLSTVNPLLCYTGIIKEIVHPDMPEAIRRIEAKERPRRYKFGLLLVKEGQKEEEDIFSNSGGSVDWYEFLNFIGDKVRLKGWNRFSGGLDVKSDTTGEFSRFTEWRGSEIMWHVATMLPPGEGSQQIARKRHIGNDICVLVFLDGKDVTYAANTIRSHFIHNVITIRRIPSESLEDDASLTRYHVSVATKGDVPVFGPPLPKPAVFVKDASFKDFLLAKMINAELAAYRTMYFSKRLRLGRRALLDSLVSNFFPVEEET